MTNRLERDRELGPFDLHVTTDEGVVTLSGRVERESQRSEATRIAREVAGVVDVVNHLETEKSPGVYPTPDVGAPTPDAPPGTRPPGADERS